MPSNSQKSVFMVVEPAPQKCHFTYDTILKLIHPDLDSHTKKANNSRAIIQFPKFFVADETIHVQFELLFHDCPA